MRQWVSKAAALSTLFLWSANANTTHTASSSVSTSFKPAEATQEHYYGIIPISLGLVALGFLAWIAKNQLQSYKEHRANQKEPGSINRSDQHSDESTPLNSPTHCCVSLFPEKTISADQPGSYAPIPTDDLPQERKKSQCAMM